MFTLCSEVLNNPSEWLAKVFVRCLNSLHLTPTNFSTLRQLDVLTSKMLEVGKVLISKTDVCLLAPMEPFGLSLFITHFFTNLTVIATSCHEIVFWVAIHHYWSLPPYYRSSKLHLRLPVPSQELPHCGNHGRCVKISMSKYLSDIQCLAFQLSSTYFIGLSLIRYPHSCPHVHLTKLLVSSLVMHLWVSQLINLTQLNPLPLP